MSELFEEYEQCVEQTAESTFSAEEKPDNVCGYNANVQYYKTVYAGIKNIKIPALIQIEIEELTDRLNKLLQDIIDIPIKISNLCVEGLQFEENIRKLNNPHIERLRKLEIEQEIKVEGKYKSYDDVYPLEGDKEFLVINDALLKIHKPLMSLSDVVLSQSKVIYQECEK